MFASSLAHSAEGPAHSPLYGRRTLVGARAKRTRKLPRRAFRPGNGNPLKFRRCLLGRVPENDRSNLFDYRILQFRWTNGGFPTSNCHPLRTMPHRIAMPAQEGVLSPRDEASLREALKRCSPATFEAACALRKTGDVSYVPLVVLGVLERFVERSLRPKFQHPSASELRLIEDLQFDSLTMLEAVLLLEDVLQITIDNDDLRELRTLGDVQRFTESKLHPSPDGGAAPLSAPNLSRPLEQRALGDHPSRTCTGPT